MHAPASCGMGHATPFVMTNGKLLFSKMKRLETVQESWGDRTNYELPYVGEPELAAAAFHKRCRVKGAKRDNMSPTGYRGPDGYPVMRPFDPGTCCGQWSIKDVLENKLIISCYDSIGD